MRQIRATISGSFQRHLEGIQRSVSELKSRGVKVLSPEQPVIVDSLDGFVFVASDRHRSVKLVQDRHLASIADSDFLWLEAPDGYVGQSASFELGFAAAQGIPVYSNAVPLDLTMRQYVQPVANIAAAVSLASANIDSPEENPSLLVDPIAATDVAAAAIARVRDLLTRPSGTQASERLHSELMGERASAMRSFRLPVTSRG